LGAALALPDDRNGKKQTQLFNEMAFYLYAALKCGEAIAQMLQRKQTSHKHDKHNI